VSKLAQVVHRLQEQHQDRINSRDGAAYRAQEKLEACIRDGTLPGERLKGRDLYELESKIDQLDRAVANDARDVQTATEMYLQAKAKLDILEAEDTRQRNADELTRLAARSVEMEAALREAAFRLTAAWSDHATVDVAIQDLGGREPPHAYLGEYLRSIGIEVD